MENPKLTKIKEKIGQLSARAKLIEAKERSRAKKDDTRRKILAGALALEKAEKDQEEKKKLMAELDGFLTRPMDRDLFGLPEKPKSQNPPTEKPAGEKADVTPKPTEKRKSA